MESSVAAEGFAALAQPRRLELMRLLASTGATGMPAGDIAAHFGSPSSSLSCHLSALERAGLVQSTRQSRHIIYAIRLAGLRSLFSFLTEACCGGRRDLCGDLVRLLPEKTCTEDNMIPKFNALFLCTHNSARSIMAEAILARFAGARFNAYAAGSHPAAEPMPEVMSRLAVLGHDVSKLRSKSWQEFMGPDAPRMDFVITLCDTTVGQMCPDFDDRPVTAAWPFPDPAKFSGSEVERIAFVNELYGMIRRRLEAFASLPFDKLDRIALKARLDELSEVGKAGR